MNRADPPERQPLVAGEPVRIVQLDRGGEAGERSQDEPTDGATQKHEGDGCTRAVRMRALQQLIVVERLAWALRTDEALQCRAGGGRCGGFLDVPHLVRGEYDSRADGIAAERAAVHRPDEDRQRDQGDQKSREQNDDRIHGAASLSELPFKMAWNSAEMNSPLPCIVRCESLMVKLVVHRTSPQRTKRLEHAVNGTDQAAHHVGKNE